MTSTLVCVCKAFQYLGLTFVREPEASCSFEVPQDTSGELYVLRPRICQESTHHRHRIRNVSSGSKYNIYQRPDNVLVGDSLIWRASVV